MALLKRKPAVEPLSAEVREWLAENVPVESFMAMAGIELPVTELQPRYEKLRCRFCQGIHFRKCPSVQSYELYETGAIHKVVYWPDGSYDDSDVIWPEMIFRDDDVDGPPKA